MPPRKPPGEGPEAKAVRKRPTRPKGRGAEEKRREATEARRVEREKRNSEVVLMRIRTHASWATIAAEHGVTEGYARKLYKEYRRVNQGALTEMDAIDLLEELYAYYDGLIERAGDLSLKAEAAAQFSAAVGALGRQEQGMLSQLELLRATKVMPDDLSRFQTLFEARTIQQRFARVCEAWKVPEELKDALVASIDPVPQPLLMPPD